MKIKLSELKRVIREEVRRARVRKLIEAKQAKKTAKKLNEQGRPVGPTGPGRPFELGDLETPRGRPSFEGGEAYAPEEFIDYLRLSPGRGRRGRPFEFEVDFGNDTLTTLTGDQIVAAYDPDGSVTGEVYDKNGAFLATIPMDLPV